MPKKVFELAKEMDIRSLDLVEQLRAKGYAVRNHMSSLTDEEAEEFRTGLLEKEQVPAESEKKAKKKVTKKSAAKKKKIVTVAAKKTTKKSTSKKVAVRKKVTLRKKRKIEEEKDSEQNEDLFKDNKVSEEAIQKSTENSSEVEIEDGFPRLKKFTSVYVPKKDGTWKKSTDEESAKNDADIKTTEIQNKEKSTESDSKRKLGDLASMISKKRHLNRSHVLQESRSEDELKSYSALSGMGRPIYTTIKKRKQYTGPVKETSITEIKEEKRIIKIHNAITVVNFAKKLKVKFKEFGRSLFGYQSTCGSR